MYVSLSELSPLYISCTDTSTLPRKKKSYGWFWVYALVRECLKSLVTVRIRSSLLMRLPLTYAATVIVSARLKPSIPVIISGTSILTFHLPWKLFKITTRSLILYLKQELHVLGWIWQPCSPLEPPQVISFGSSDSWVKGVVLISLNAPTLQNSKILLTVILISPLWLYHLYGE